MDGIKQVTPVTLARLPSGIGRDVQCSTALAIALSILPASEKMRDKKSQPTRPRAPSSHLRRAAPQPQRPLQSDDRRTNLSQLRAESARRESSSRPPALPLAPP